jgi:hypothetical protein
MMTCSDGIFLLEKLDVVEFVVIGTKLCDAYGLALRSSLVCAGNEFLAYLHKLCFDVLFFRN